MSFKFKSLLLFIKILTKLLLLRPYVMLSIGMATEVSHVKYSCSVRSCFSSVKFALRV